MRRQLAIDVAIAEAAGRQGGVVGRSQLLAIGLSGPSIDRRVRAGRLHILHRGVYAVGHTAIGVVGWRWAAVLACGAGAVLSHGSAAAAWDLRASSSPRMHVTVPSCGGRARRPSMQVHRMRLAAEETTTFDGLPITTPARTLLDLAATGLRGRRLETVLDRAEHLRLVDFGALRSMLAARPGARGVRALDTILARYAPGSVDTRSVLEDIVLDLCDEHEIPRPQVNVVIEGSVRDFHWPDRRLVVEADSYTWHRSPSALDDDRERDVRLALAGYAVLRFTYEQCTKRRDYVASSILRALVAS
jgi:hypothetical protein